MSERTYAKPTEERLIEWVRKDLWSLSEFSKWCCGIDPYALPENATSALFPYNDEELFGFKSVERIIRRATIGEALPYFMDKDVQPDDETYQENCFFKPPDAIQWANGRFPNFPKQFFKLLPSSEEDSEKVAKNVVPDKPEIKDPASQSNVYDVFWALLNPSLSPYISNPIDNNGLKIFLICYGTTFVLFWCDNNLHRLAGIPCEFQCT